MKTCDLQITWAIGQLGNWAEYGTTFRPVRHTLVVFLLPGRSLHLLHVRVPLLRRVGEDRTGGQVSVAKRHWEPPLSGPSPSFYAGGPPIP